MCTTFAVALLSTVVASSSSSSDESDGDDGSEDKTPKRRTSKRASFYRQSRFTKCVVVAIVCTSSRLAMFACAELAKEVKQLTSVH